MPVRLPSLLSMPVRLLRRLTGTALRAAIRSPAGRRPRPNAGQQPQASGKKTFTHSAHCPAGRHSVTSRAGDHTRMSGSSRKPAEEKESPFPSGKNVHVGENHHAGNETPRRSGHSLGKTTNPASRGAKAIPAQRERRSRRAYRPRSGKMRADLPPAASGGQGTRHATATPAAIRDKGEYGGRRGCRGVRPSHPLPHLCCRCP